MPHGIWIVEGKFLRDALGMCRSSQAFIAGYDAISSIRLVNWIVNMPFGAGQIVVQAGGFAAAHTANHFMFALYSLLCMIPPREEHYREEAT